MSRIGRTPIPIPSGVELTIDANRVTVKGPKGELSREIHPDMELVRENGTLEVRRPTESRQHRSLHGLTRTLVANMVTGVTSGFEKTLEIYGVGYRGSQAGRPARPGARLLAPGRGHRAPRRRDRRAADLLADPGQRVAVDPLHGPRHRQGAGRPVAAELHALRPPEPYKGKGIRYQGERIRRKAGKAAARPREVSRRWRD